MSRRWIIAVLLGLFAVQWMIPLTLIQGHQSVLDEGTAYRFRTTPVDPVDPFRGRYVTLGFAASRVTVAEPDAYERNTRMYAPLRVDEDGFAYLLPPLGEPPAEGDYLVVRVMANVGERALRVALPFDRFYLEESRAPRAEALLRRREGDAGPQVWAEVRVLGDRAVIADLVVDGRPLRQWLRAHPAGD